MEFPKGKRAENYRKIAYGLFFLSLGVLLFGFIPAMYYGSLIGVIATLSVAAGLFIGAFITGGLGWSSPDASLPTEAPHYGSSTGTGAHDAPTNYTSSAPGAPEGDEGLYPRPHPSDESRPPVE